MDEKIEGHRTHKIHFHLFRKFFLTKEVDALGDHAGHALIGHGFYMDTYYRKSEVERKADYLKLMPHLTVWSKQAATKDEIMHLVYRQSLLMNEFTEEEVDSLGDLSQKTAKEISELVKQKRNQELGLHGNGSQKIVRMAELPQLIEAGWEFKISLPNGEAVVGLPTR